MKLLVVVALAAVCLAAPYPFDHPTPINPSVLIESKPQDKIIIISDVNEIVKYKRETSKPLYPTSLPEIRLHHVTKREHKNIRESKSFDNLKTTESPKSSSPPSHTQTSILEKILPASGPSTPKRIRRDLQTTQIQHASNGLHTHVHEENLTLHEIQKPQLLPVLASDQHKRDIPVPLVAKHKHPEITHNDDNEEDLKKKSDRHTNPTKEESTQQITPDKEVQVEDLSGFNSSHESLGIHLSPLPKHVHKFQPHHPLEDHGLAIQDTKSADLNSNTDSNSPNDHVPDSSTGHPVIRPKPVPVAELFARHHDNQDK